MANNNQPESPEVEVAKLEGDEHRDAKSRQSPRAAVVYEAVRREGEQELSRPAMALAWSGLAAGLSMGFSFLTESLLVTYLPAAGWRPIVSDFGYSMGFIIVILGRQQLFTENTLTPVLELLRIRSLACLARVLRLWIVVLLANTLGAFLFALVVAKTPLLGPHMNEMLGEVSVHAFSTGFGATLMRGVFAGWLIACLMWLLPFAETARVYVIILLTYIIALGQFSHIIAGSVDAFYAVLTGRVPWSHFFMGFYLPTLLGNIAGGVPLVALINYAQVIFIKKRTDG